MIEEEK